MIGQFKYEIRQLSKGFTVMKEKRESSIALNFEIVKAVVIWKVRRLVLAIRSWNVWAIGKRDRRFMILKARGAGQRGIKERACRYWLAIAAAADEDDRSVRMKALIVRVAKKWKSLVYRNRVMRQKQREHDSLTNFCSNLNLGRPPVHRVENLNLNGAEESLSNATDSKTLSLLFSNGIMTPHTNSGPFSRNKNRNKSSCNGNHENGTLDLLKAKPRVLDTDPHPHLFLTTLLSTPQSLRRVSSLPFTSTLPYTITSITATATAAASALRTGYPESHTTEGCTETEERTPSNFYKKMSYLLHSSSGPPSSNLHALQPVVEEDKMVEMNTNTYTDRYKESDRNRNKIRETENHKNTENDVISEIYKIKTKRAKGEERGSLELIGSAESCQVRTQSLGLAYAPPRTFLRTAQECSGSILQVKKSSEVADRTVTAEDLPPANLRSFKISDKKSLLAQEIIEFITEMRIMDQLLCSNSHLLEGEMGSK